MRVRFRAFLRAEKKTKENFSRRESVFSFLRGKKLTMKLAIKVTRHRSSGIGNERTTRPIVPVDRLLYVDGWEKQRSSRRRRRRRPLCGGARVCITAGSGRDAPSPPHLCHRAAAADCAIGYICACTYVTYRRYMYIDTHIHVYSRAHTKTRARWPQI